jgi:phosphoserine phosphatase
VSDALAGHPIDLHAGPASGRRKRLLIADMDSTIITVECIDEIADFAGKRAEVAAITEQAMRGELDFAAALRARAAMLGGLDESVLAAAFAARVRLMPGARALVATMRANGAITALVSGGFTYFTSRVRVLAGFDLDRANTLEIANGKLAGRVSEPIQGAEAKLAALRELIATHRLDPSETLAVGDGANDIPMIQAAGLGVAYHAKPRTAAAARARVDHADLTALLYLQGYRQSELIA